MNLKKIGMNNKTSILALLLVFMALSTLQAQQTPTAPKPIDMKVNLLGYRFFQDGERLTWRELEAATVAVEEANQLIKRAKSQRTISNVLAFVGGGLIGIPLGQQSADRDPTWELAYIGGAIAVGSWQSDRHRQRRRTSSGRGRSGAHGNRRPRISACLRRGIGPPIPP